MGWWDHVVIAGRQLATVAISLKVCGFASISILARSPRIHHQVRARLPPSHFLVLPLPPQEEEHADHAGERLSERDRQEHSRRAHTRVHGQHPGQRYLEQPEAEEVDHGRRARVSRAVEGLLHHHTHRVEQVAEADVAQGIDTGADHGRLAVEDADDRLRH